MSQLLVVSDGTPQTLYIGEVSDEQIGVVLDHDATQKVKPDGDGFVTLTNCRYLRTMMMPTPQGISLHNNVMSIGTARGSITLRVKPLMYYWPNQNEADLEIITRLIRVCEENEQKHRAEAAGIAIPKVKMGRMTE